MAGTRRATAGSGRPTRAEYRPQERRERLNKRLRDASTSRERVSWSAAHLRAVMADPNLPTVAADQAADQAVKYLIALADQLEKATTRQEQK